MLLDPFLIKHLVGGLQLDIALVFFGLFGRQTGEINVVESLENKTDLLAHST